MIDFAVGSPFCLHLTEQTKEEAEKEAEKEEEKEEEEEEEEKGLLIIVCVTIVS